MVISIYGAYTEHQEFHILSLDGLTNEPVYISELDLNFVLSSLDFTRIFTSAISSMD